MHGIVESWLARGQQRPADAPPDAGRVQQPTHEIREPVGAPPTGEHAEAEAAAIRAAAAAGRPARIAGGFAVGGTVPVDGDEDRARREDERRRGQGWPPAPDYRAPSSLDTIAMLTEIDQQINAALSEVNREQLVQARSALSRVALAERMQRVAEDRYAQAEAERVRMTAAWERASAEADRLRKDFGEVWAERNELASENAQLKGRVVELELTVKALGKVVAHAAGHGEGGE